MPQDKGAPTSRRGIHARRNAIVARSLRPLLVNEKVQKSLAEHTGIEIDTIKNLLNNWLIKESDLQKIIDHARFEWYLTDAAHQMLIELAALETPSTPEGQNDPNSNEALHKMLHDAINKVWQSPSDHNESPMGADLDESEGLGDPPQADFPEDEMDSDGIPSSYDQPAWVGKNSFLIEKEGIRILLELDNIPEDRLNSILLVLEQILNYAAHKTDYFTVRLNPDGQISGDFGNVVPPSAFNN